MSSTFTTTMESIDKATTKLVGMTTPKDVKSRLKYLQWDDLFLKEKPFEILIDIPPNSKDQRRTNLTFEEGPEEIIHDVRRSLSDFTLDTSGFTFLKHQSQLTPEQFGNRDSVRDIYLPECEELLKRTLDNVDQVYFYNWRLRRSELSGRHGSVVNFSDPLYPVGVATHAHVDQSPGTILDRIKIHLPDQEEFLLRGRVRHVNIWRPINGPVENNALAVCDGRSISPENLIPTDRIRRQFSGDTMFAKFGQGFKWYYMSQQNDDEPLLFKSFDSKLELTQYAPHAAFQIPDAPENCRARESIEVRALVFTHPNC